MPTYLALDALVTLDTHVWLLDGTYIGSATTPPETPVLPGWRFQPPIGGEVPRTHFDMDLGDQHFWSHFRRGPVGRNVWKLLDGTYTERQPLDELVLITYHGGHVFIVDDDEAASLRAAGYTVEGTSAEVGGPTWSDMAGRTWGDLTGITWADFAAAVPGGTWDDLAGQTWDDLLGVGWEAT